MSEPETYNDLMRWFGTGHKAGLYDLHGLRLLADNAKTNNPMSLWSHLLDHNLLVVSSREFWITPKGKVWNVSWAKHEFLIHYLMEVPDTAKVELAGWLRVSANNALHRTKLSRIQLETLAVLRPDIQPKLVFDKQMRRVRYPEIECFDVAPLGLPWTVWLEDFDARPE